MKYFEPHRTYHTLRHILRMFEVAQLVGIPLNESQVKAIWLHDYIYDVPAHKGTSNEELSARAYESYYPGDKIGPQIIRDTEKELPTIEESKVVIDLDLWDLSNREIFRTNNKLIRHEYNHLSDAEWYEGRIKWIESFLARDSIFVSRFSTKWLEGSARNNLEYELDRVKTDLEIALKNER